MSNTLLVRIWTFYRDGFREMTLGRTLMGLKELTSYKYVIHGNGQIRE